MVFLISFLGKDLQLSQVWESLTRLHLFFSLSHKLTDLPAYYSAAYSATKLYNVETDFPKPFIPVSSYPS